MNREMEFALPAEEASSRVIQAELSQQLGFAKNLLGDAVALIVPDIELKKPYPYSVQAILVVLHVRLCRRFRQIIALCEIGQAEGAQVICRTMFETYLALAFVARQSVRLRHRANNKPVDLFGKRLTQEFRARLVGAYGVLKYEKQLDLMLEVPGLKRYAKARLNERPASYQETVTMLGPKWKKRLRKGTTCAGLSVEDLSHSLNSLRWYRAIYSEQSSSTHSADTSLYMELPADGSGPFFAFKAMFQMLRERFGSLAP